MASRRVLITGCSTGVGRATAVSLAKRGHDVVATTRALDAVRDLPVSQVIELDVTDPESVRQSREAVGSVDVLINNAGRGMRSPIELADDEDLRILWETNVLGMVRMVRAFVPAMRERGRGRIVNISSVAGRRSMPLVGHYAASKYALEAMSEALRWELRPFGVDVVLIEPGAVATEFGRNRLAADKETSFGPYQVVLDRASRLAGRVNAPAQTVDDIADVIARAVEGATVPLRMPTSTECARMIHDRQGRSDEEFEAWLERNQAE